MRKYLYLLIISFILTSCYTYQRKKNVDVPATDEQKLNNNGVNSSITSSQVESSTAEIKNSKSQQKIDEKQLVPINIQNELQPTKNYKIKVDGRAYKIIVDKWEGDSLVAHAVNKPAKIIKLHKNQIEAETIAEKRFSQPIADIITVLVYAGIGVGIYMLVR